MTEHCPSICPWRVCPQWCWLSLLSRRVSRNTGSLFARKSFLTLGYPAKNVGKGLACPAAHRALGGSGNFTCRRGQRKTCEEGRLLCLSAYSTSTAMPILLLLPAFSVSMPWTQSCLLFPLVSCRSTLDPPYICISKHRAKGQKESMAALRSDPWKTLLFSELGKSAIFLS